ncbi:MAG: hypothetical protein RL308_91 [Bacteroidota bacterium]|jgi:hypothetical protein
MEIKLKFFRKLLRENSKRIIDHLVESHLDITDNSNTSESHDICMFCGSNQYLTKEHVVPQWTYQGCTKRKFLTNVNGIKQAYNKTTIPACAECNNERLNALEVYLNNLLNNINQDTFYLSNEELIIVIRWLETIDYKFQILNARKKFLKSAENNFIPFIKDFPLTVLRPQINYSPYSAITEIRRSAKRMTIKNKLNKLNSIHIFKTTNTDFHFFHQMDEYIFIELPQYKIAIFYFYKRTFDSLEESQLEAKAILETTY